MANAALEPSPDPHIKLLELVADEVKAVGREELGVALMDVAALIRYGSGPVDVTLREAGEALVLAGRDEAARVLREAIPDVVRLADAARDIARELPRESAPQPGTDAPQDLELVLQAALAREIGEIRWWSRVDLDVAGYAYQVTLGMGGLYAASYRLGPDVIDGGWRDEALARIVAAFRAALVARRLLADPAEPGTEVFRIFPRLRLDPNGSELALVCEPLPPGDPGTGPAMG